MGVNSLPKTVTRQHSGCDLNPGPTTPESSTLTTRLPSHHQYCSATSLQCRASFIGSLHDAAGSLLLLVGWSRVERPTRHNIGHFGGGLHSQSLD